MYVLSQEQRAPRRQLIIPQCLIDDRSHHQPSRLQIYRTCVEWRGSGQMGVLFENLSQILLLDAFKCSLIMTSQHYVIIQISKLYI